MVAFLIARLPSHPKSLDAVAYMQKNGFSYRISTSIPLMNFLMTSEGGDSRQLEVFEELEPGKEEVHVIANMTCIFSPQTKVEVESTETPATNENSAPLVRIVKEEVDASTISSVTPENVEPRENPSVDAGHAEEEVVDEHQEQLGEEMNSFLNQGENDDVMMNDNVLLAEDHEFDESNAEKPMNIPLAVIEDGVHHVLTEPVLEEVQQGAEEHEEPNFLDEEEGVGDEQRVEGGEGRELTVDELLEPLDAGDSTMALRPIHNNDLLFDFEDSSRLSDDLQLEKEIMEPEDGHEENMEIDRNVEEFEEEEELVEEQDHEDEKMDAEIEELSNEGIDDEGDMDEEEVDSDEEEVSDDEEDASSDEESDGEQTAQKKAKVGRGTRNSIGRHLYTCFVKNCSSSYNTFKQLEDHVKVHPGKQDFVCDVCKKKFTSKATVMRHIQERKKKKCCACGKMFSRTYHLIEHNRTHTGEKPYVCKMCAKGFAQTGNLMNHMLTHTGKKRFSCRVCKKNFALKSTLEKHERTHTGDKPFKCSHCDFRCSHACSLTSHNRTHTGEKPYSCGHCKKRFSKSGDLKKHELTHTGEKAYKCKDCGKRFGRKDHLNRHIRIHTGQKPFSCKKCDAKFTFSESLKYHTEHKHK